VRQRDPGEHRRHSDDLPHKQPHVRHSRHRRAVGRTPAAAAEEYVYLRYNHAANVDLSRMQQDLQRTLGILKRVVPSGAD